MSVCLSVCLSVSLSTRAVSDEQFEHALVSVGLGVRQRRSTVADARIDVGAMLQQHSRNENVAQR